MDNTIQAHQKELCNKLWAMANALRGNMEAYEFKNYILGMIFYYYLSDKTEKYMVNLLKDDGIGYEEAWADPEYKEAVVEEALRDLGFVIEPQFLFRKMVKMVENRSFDIEFLQKAINSLMESTIGNDSQEDFDGLFSDMQLDSTKLGHTVKDRSAVMSKIISSLDEINFGVEDTKIDVLGNAYEYLIGQFAATAGKRLVSSTRLRALLNCFAGLLVLGCRMLRMLLIQLAAPVLFCYASKTMLMYATTMVRSLPLLPIILPE